MDANKQWMNRPADERFETLDALRASVQDRRMRSRSVDIDLPRIEASNIEGGLIINSGIQPSKPSHWAFGQLATTVKAPAGYLRTLPAPMVVDLLNHGLRNSERESVKFMTVEPNENAQGVGESSTLQAVTSPTYGRIWDADVTDAVQRIVERTNGKFYNPLSPFCMMRVGFRNLGVAFRARCNASGLTKPKSPPSAITGTIAMIRPLVATATGLPQFALSSQTRIF